jgi:hypothetical protein
VAYSVYIYFTIFCLSFFGVISHLNAEALQSIRENPASSLKLSLNSSLSMTNVMYVRSFLKQVDNWSCGIRAAFHAQSVNEAIRQPKKFEVRLKERLQNQNHLDEIQKTHGSTHPLSNYDLEKLAGLFKFRDNLIIVKVQEQSISYLGRVNPNVSICHYLTKIHNQSRAFHIIALIRKHWILFSYVKLKGDKYQLLVIDSSNQSLKADQIFLIESLSKCTAAKKQENIDKKERNKNSRKQGRKNS